MRIQLLYFGMLKDIFRAECDNLDLPASARVEDALRILRAGMLDPRVTVHDGIWDTLAVAVNREYAGASTLLNDGDELALLPPVSGGLDPIPCAAATQRNPQ